MRCLGRIVSLVLLLILLGVGWLYRDEIRRRVRAITDPMGEARARVVVSPEMAGAGQRKLRQLDQAGVDSVILSPAETGALLLDGLRWTPEGTVDSLRVELGDRTVHFRGLVSTAALTSAVRDYIKLPLASHETITVTGTLTPARPGTAEWRMERATLHGIPLPANLLQRLLASTGMPAIDGLLQVPLPAGVGGFRVRPDGAVFYRREGRP